MARIPKSSLVVPGLLLMAMTACDPAPGVFGPDEDPDPDPDPLQDALDALDAIDADLADSLLALPRVEDGIDEDETDAIVALVAAVEAVDATDDRAVALLRSLGPAGFEDDVILTDIECSLDAGVDIVEVAASLDDPDLLLEITARGDIGPDVAVVVNIDHGEGSLFTTQLALWVDGGDLQVWIYEWTGPTIDADWDSSPGPQGLEMTVDGATAELSLPLDVLLDDDVPDELRVQAMLYDLATEDYDYAPFVPLLRTPVHGPVMDLLELALIGDVTADPELAVVTAIAEAPIRRAVEDDLVDTVWADAADMVAAGLELGLSELGLWEKLFWAYRGTENVLYSPIALALLPWPMDAEGYEFNVMSADVMAWYGELAVQEGLVGSSAAVTAAAVDAWLWDNLQYRTGYDAMSYFCDEGFLDPEICNAWEAELAAGEDYLGEVMGEPIYYYDASSPSYQMEMFGERGTFYGDCGTHTTLATTMLKALGIAPASGQYYGAATELTHNFPLYFDPGLDGWSTAQLPCSYTYADTETFYYTFLPPRQLLDFVSFEQASDMQLAGGAMAPDHLTFGDLCDELTAGVPADEMVDALFERWWEI